jgi:hypothetical protein
LTLLDVAGMVLKASSQQQHEGAGDPTGVLPKGEVREAPQGDDHFREIVVGPSCGHPLAG